MRDRKSQAELAYLWTSVRRVSKDFEREIEKLYHEEHLGRTWIHADWERKNTFRSWRKLRLPLSPATATTIDTATEDPPPTMRRRQHLLYKCGAV
ncbi:MAG: hypothetical protein Q9161_004818 [Pseudevernia consocians]